MKINEALTILEQHNKWRRGDDSEMEKPKVLGKAIDVVIKFCKSKIKHNVINWVAIADEKPETEWGDFLICLENNSIHKANYSTIAGERWLVVGVGEICENNPVKYWAELPEPPCLQHQNRRWL